MNRRDALKLLSSTGICAVGPTSLARAQAAEPDRHFVFVHAGGGWDPTSLCDPKGDTPRSDDRGPVNHYRQEDITQASNSPIRYAPFPDADLASSTLRDDAAITSFAPFFEDIASDLLVINGIDTQTNSHSIGTRTTWSGSAKLGQPAFAALAAQAQAPASPLAFITNGGYDVADSLVAPARISGSGTLRELAYPDRANTRADADLDNTRTYFLAPEIRDLVENTRRSRQQRLLQHAALPQRRAAMSQLFLANGSDSGLNRLINALPADLSSGLRGQAEVAVAAFGAKLAVSANLSAGGFDTHGDHDRNQTFSLARLIDGVHYLWQLIKSAGLQDRVTVLVSSDFGRTPFYNDGDGKDHWNVTSLMALGAGIRGNRVLGGTSANFEALKIDPQTLQPAADQNDPSAVVLTPGHVHLGLRDMAGIASNEVVRRYPLDGELLPIFS